MLSWGSSIHRLGASVLALAAAACASAPPPKPAVSGPVAPAAARVEKVHEPLEVTPLELHFSGLRGATGASESVTVKNTGNEPDQVSDLRVVGADAATFKILNTPLLPLILPPGRSFSFSVGFEPAGNAEPGVHHARVRLVRTEDDDGPPCDLTGLVTGGKRPADEPTLQQILEALGYDVDVGSKVLKSPAAPPVLGDEIAAPLFQRAKPGSVGYYLIARYAGDEASSFGYYLVDGKKVSAKPIASVAKEHNHMLNPELDGESQTSFDPGDEPFGLYLKAGKHTLYSDRTRNPRAASVARAFPLRSRGRTPVQDAFVVAFDDDGDGDFQDHIFMLWNARPAGH
jgi:hypothetical protein